MRFRSRAAQVFLLSFAVSAILLGAQFWLFGLSDSGLWGDEARYVIEHDPREFDFLAGYGHPGGPIIEGTVLVRDILGSSYELSDFIFLDIALAAVIGAICAACYRRTGDRLWIAVLGILSLNRLYQYATPPSALAAVLVVLYMLISLGIYERGRSASASRYAAWSLVAGALVATRADIGIFMSFAFFAALALRADIRKLFISVVGSIATFVILDPFMWSMPLQHIRDLAHKGVIHYVDFAPSPLSAITVIAMSALSILSIFIAVMTGARNQEPQPVRRDFIGILLLATIALYAIILNSQYQAVRYFLPILFVWETLLPLFVLSYVPFIDISFARTERGKERGKALIATICIALLWLYHIVFILQSFWFNQYYLPMP